MTNDDVIWFQTFFELEYPQRVNGVESEKCMNIIQDELYQIGENIKLHRFRVSYSVPGHTVFAIVKNEITAEQEFILRLKYKVITTESYH